MTVPSTATWNLSVDDILERANRRVTGSRSSAYEIEAGVVALQVTLREMELVGINLWSVDEGANVLTYGEETVLLDEDTIDLLEVTRRDTRTNTDIILYRMPREDYVNLTDKFVSGTPTQYYFDRQRDQPFVKLWPVPSEAYWELRYTRWRSLRDIGDMTSEVDIGRRFMPALIAGCAYHMALEAPGLDEMKIGRLNSDWQASLFRAAEEDRDRTPLRIEPDIWAYTR